MLGEPADLGAVGATEPAEVAVVAPRLEVLGRGELGHGGARETADQLPANERGLVAAAGHPAHAEPR